MSDYVNYSINVYSVIHIWISDNGQRFVALIKDK